MPDLDMHYVLDDEGNPVPATDLITWAKALDNIELRRVGLTKFSDRTEISTVFLGLDHGFTKKRPLLFETLTQFGQGGDEMDRYGTWQEAVDGHRKVVETYLLENPEVRIRRSDIRDKYRPVERRSVWERLRFDDKKF